MDSRIDRRAFLGAGMAAAAGVTVSGAEPSAPPIVDTHVHLWDLTRFRLPWIQPGSTLDRSFLPDDFARATAGLGVAKGVYMEVDVAPDQLEAEADFVIELCRRGDTPIVGAVIGGRPASDGFPAYLRRIRDAGAVKGVRQVLHGGSTPAGYCLDPAFVRGIRALGEAGLSFDLCPRPAELADVRKLVAECTGTSFILDHCGNPSVRSKDLSTWRDEIRQLGDRPNLVCKVSGIVASAAGGPWTADDLAPIVNHVLDSFGPDRVVFGGDWPVCTLAATYRRWVEALREIVRDRPWADQCKLFGENAVRIYRLG